MRDAEIPSACCINSLTCVRVMPSARPLLASSSCWVILLAARSHAADPEAPLGWLTSGQMTSDIGPYAAVAPANSI